MSDTESKLNNLDLKKILLKSLSTGFIAFVSFHLGVLLISCFSYNGLCQEILFLRLCFAVVTNCMSCSSRLHAARLMNRLIRYV